MKKEEAIRILQHCEAENYCQHYIETRHCDGCNRREALDMSIGALSEPNKSTNRPTGEWINKGEYAECSICGAHSGRRFNGGELIPFKTKFCHNCGAEMKIPLYVYASWDRSEE